MTALRLLKGNLPEPKLSLSTRKRSSPNTVQIFYKIQQEGRQFLAPSQNSCLEGPYATPPGIMLLRALHWHSLTLGSIL